ncbi:hypothetical protein V8C86DRAFT_2794855, partial [Haematococcus lacustris]
MAALLGPPQSMSMDSAGDARAGEGGSVMRAADFRALMADRTPLLASRGLGAAAQFAKRQRMLPPGFISSLVLPGLVGLASPHSPAHQGVPASPLPYAQGPGSEGGASHQSQPLNLAALHAPSLQANYTADLLAVFQRTPAAAATASPDACLTTPRHARRLAAASPRSGGPRTLRSATALPLAAAATPLSPPTSQVPGASAGALQPSPATQQQVAPRLGGAVPETPTVVTAAAAAGGQGVGLGLGAPAGSVSRSLDFPDMPPPTTEAPPAVFDLDAAPGADPETALEAGPGQLDVDAHPPHPTSPCQPCRMGGGQLGQVGGGWAAIWALLQGGVPGCPATCRKYYLVGWRSLTAQLHLPHLPASCQSCKCHCRSLSSHRAAHALRHRGASLSCWCFKAWAWSRCKQRQEMHSPRSPSWMWCFVSAERWRVASQARQLHDSNL